MLRSPRRAFALACALGLLLVAALYLLTRAVPPEAVGTPSPTPPRVGSCHRGLLVGCVLVPPTPLATSTPGPASTATPAPTATPVPPACTLYTSPTGVDTNTGRSAGSPMTEQGVERLTVAGDVVCFAPGTYTPTSNGEAALSIARSGNAVSGPVTYRANGGVATLELTGSRETNDSIIKIDPGTNYITITGLNFNGRNLNRNAIYATGSTSPSLIINHHYVFTNNTIINAGIDGISTVDSDYVTVAYNTIWHTGYAAVSGCGDPCAGSGISLNSNGWSDNAAGFHSYVYNNVVAGSTDTSTVLTDGNGIIMDRSFNTSGSNTPPVLIANNVVYMNGGRCIHMFVTSNDWVVHNDCYKNTLRLAPPTSPQIGEISMNTVITATVVNNTVYGWNGHPPYSESGSSNITFAKDAWFGGGAMIGVSGAIQSNPAMMLHADPTYTSPPYVDPTNDGSYALAPDPTLIGSTYRLLSSSPLIAAGIDPRTLTADSTLISQLTANILTDITGTARPHGTAWDIGAYVY